MPRSKSITIANEDTASYRVADSHRLFEEIFINESFTEYLVTTSGDYRLGREPRSTRGYSRP